jgi:hypothetical protein
MFSGSDTHKVETFFIQDREILFHPFDGLSYKRGECKIAVNRNDLIVLKALKM